MTRIADDIRADTGDQSDWARSGGSEIPEELTVLPPDTAPWFTIIVPTRNEEGSVAVLLDRLADELADVRAEVLFVDDSSDDTPEAIRAVARECGLPVRLLHRPPGARRGGLGGAVVAGLRCARGTWAVVMDGDLQHPPELAARLVADRPVPAVGSGRRHPLPGSRGRRTGWPVGYRHAVSGLATTG